MANTRAAEPVSEVSGSVELLVSDPAAFVQDQSAEPAVTEALSAQWRPDVHFDVNLRSDVRRLQNAGSRRLRGKVVADFTATVPEAEAKAMVKSFKSSFMAASLNRTLTERHQVTVMNVTATYTPAEPELETSRARRCAAHVAIIALALVVLVSAVFGPVAG